MRLGECVINYHIKKTQKLILQNHIFKDVNIDKLLEYNVLRHEAYHRLYFLTVARGPTVSQVDRLI